MKYTPNYTHLHQLIVMHYQKEEAQINFPVNIDITSIKANITKQEITPQTSSVEIYESIIK